MNQGAKLFVIFFLTAVLGGCSSSCGNPDQSNINGENISVIVPEKATNAPVNANNNANLVNGLANMNSKNPTLDNSKVKVIDTTNVKIEVPKKTMPDNSEMTVSMDKQDFVETRKFLNNPDLDKLERITSGKNVKVRVYLKNGKIFDLPDGKIKDYRMDTANMILEVVGVNPTSTKGSNGKTKEEQSKEKSVKQ